jgi:hypothetical protein
MVHKAARQVKWQVGVEENLGDFALDQRCDSSLSSTRLANKIFMRDRLSTRAHLSGNLSTRSPEQQCGHLSTPPAGAKHSDDAGWMFYMYL